MDINTRIKSLRMQLGLSQADFGDQIGVSRDVINNIDNARTDVKDYMVRLICAVYGIDEHWLRTGEGNMYAATPTDIMDDLAARYHLSDIDRHIIAAYVALDDDARRGVRTYIMDIAQRTQK